MTAVSTTCPYCGVGCGVRAFKDTDGMRVEGDPQHPANFGRLCSKGSALAETISLEDRLLHPSINGEQADWDSALDLIAERFKNTIAEFGNESVAFYVSGQILTEDYYVANKLMKGFIGTANIDTNSRLCMASSVVGHKRAFGADTVPGVYEDFEKADQIILVGSNLAWCHPVLFQRIMSEKERRPSLRIVVIDPRKTRTADVADLWLPILPDGDGALFNGLLEHISASGKINESYLRDHVNGFDAALLAAKQSQATLQQDTGLDGAALASFYDNFTEIEKTVTIYSQGVNQSVGGTDKVNAIINCHLATGRIGREGMGPFSITGQPNAMGGREVGGLATMLAAHMDLDNPTHQATVQEFWSAPQIANKVGLKAVEMFDAVQNGQIKAIWIMGTNPVDSLPMGAQVEAALKACPFVVVSDVVSETDTLRHADVKLPSLAWGEKSGTVTNSERRISRQKPFLPAPGQTKADWWQLAEVGKRMGHKVAFDFESAASIFREHAALSGYKNDGVRDFDISALEDISDREYDALIPFIWPKPKSGAQQKRFFAKGGFFTPDKKARMLPITPAQNIRARKDQFLLNTGRVRDHWHTMTRTGRSATNSAHLAEPFCEIHPDDAAKLNITPASLVRLTRDGEEAILRALVTERQRQGEVFAPIHWTDQFSSAGRIGRLVAPKRDPFSGQPALKMSQVQIEPAKMSCYGFLVSTQKPSFTITPDYWALAKTSAGWRMEFAYLGAMPLDEIGDAFSLNSPSKLSFNDNSAGLGARIWVEERKFSTGLWIATTPVQVSRSLLVDALGAEVTPQSSMQILSGRASAGMPDKGAIICSCEQVGANDIRAAILSGASDVASIGKACGAGTNCGSCRTELKGFLDQAKAIAAE